MHWHPALGHLAPNSWVDELSLWFDARENIRQTVLLLLLLLTL